MLGKAEAMDREGGSPHGDPDRRAAGRERREAEEAPERREAPVGDEVGGLVPSGAPDHFVVQVRDSIWAGRPFALRVKGQRAMEGQV